LRGNGAKRVARLDQAGRPRLPSGRGVYDWSSRDGAALLDARKAELFRWLKADRAAVRRKGKRK